MNEQLQSDIRDADPLPSGEDAAFREVVGRMAAEARAASGTMSAARPPWWKRRRIAIPVGVVGAIALTGAAVSIPLSFGVNGAQVDLDAEIPIVYTTDNGIDVRCRFGIFIGDPANRTEADEELAEFVENHDWTGVGQRIYDEAVANPFVPGPRDDWEVDNQQLRDSFSFDNALNLIIWREIPADLAKDAQSAGATSDCMGQLH